MTVMGFLVSISWLLVVILVLVDVITRDPSRIRHLDKTMWVIIVIIIPLIGSILWFAIGREWDQRADLGSFGDPAGPRRSDPLRRPPPSATVPRSSGRSRSTSSRRAFGGSRRRSRRSAKPGERNWRIPSEQRGCSVQDSML
jgi:hypothetical protein